MVEQSKPEAISQRFSGYIDILREFLTSRDVPFGTPEDVTSFAQRVSEEGAFQEEMASMVRTVMYQEDERLGRGELLQLLMVTVGGNAVEGAERPELQAAVRQIFVFINATLRQSRRSLLDPATQDDAPIPSDPVDEIASASIVPAPPPERTRTPQSAPPERPAAASSPTPGHSAAPAGEELPTVNVRYRSMAVPPAAASAAPAPASSVAPEPAPNYAPKPASRPASSVPAAASAPPVPARAAAEPGPTRTRAASGAGSEVLFRAMALSAEDDRGSDPEELEMPRETARQRWLVPAVAAVLSVLGIGAYLARPLLHGRAVPAAVAPPAEGASATPVAGSCVAPIAAGTSRSSLDERARWAHNLLNQSLYSAALPELRDIARLDPGYPGIKLDESEALLHLKRPEDALEAVDSQISTSECLSRLPDDALESYCAAQLPVGTLTACRPQLAHVRQAAELQAALVHLELGHQVMPSGSSSAAIRELNEATRPQERQRATHAPAVARKSELEPLPPATEGDADQPALPRPSARTSGRRAPVAGDDLRHGDGTDSAFGAYQKPQ